MENELRAHDVFSVYCTLPGYTHWRMTVSIQEELHSGTLRHARALALMMKSFTLSLIFWALTSCGEKARMFTKYNKTQELHSNTW